MGDMCPNWPFCRPMDNPRDVEMWNRGYDDFMDGVFDEFICMPKKVRPGLNISLSDGFY